MREGEGGGNARGSKYERKVSRPRPLTRPRPTASHHEPGPRTTRQDSSSGPPFPRPRGRWCGATEREPRDGRNVRTVERDRSCEGRTRRDDSPSTPAFHLPLSLPRRFARRKRALDRRRPACDSRARELQDTWGRDRLRASKGGIAYRRVSLDFRSSLFLPPPVFVSRSLRGVVLIAVSLLAVAATWADVLRRIPRRATSTYP